MLGACWTGSFEYEPDTGFTRHVAVSPGDAGGCTVTITEQDDQGWGQQKVCPGPSAWNWWDLDYFVQVEPADCVVTEL